jgi:hypothetical protein
LYVMLELVNAGIASFGKCVSEPRTRAPTRTRTCVVFTVVARRLHLCCADLWGSAWGTSRQRGDYDGRVGVRAVVCVPPSLGSGQRTQTRRACTASPSQPSNFAQLRFYGRCKHAFGSAHIEAPTVDTVRRTVPIRMHATYSGPEGENPTLAMAVAAT